MSYRAKVNRRRTTLRKKRINTALIAIACSLLLFVGAGVTTFGIVYQTLQSEPDITKDTAAPAQTTKIYAADGTLLTELFYEQDREVVPLKSISKYMQMATIAIEDERFYQHQGYDPKGIMRALSANLKAGKTVEGASTITQQYVKTVLDETTDRSVNNKLKEAGLAYALEKKYTKNQILEKYLNSIYFGQSLYGVETASQKYFGKSAKDLTLSEGATLAGIITSPNVFSPWINAEKAKGRRDEVLKKMLELKKITREEYAGAVATPLTVRPPQKTTTIAPYFVEYVKQLLLNDPKFGDKKVFKGGLRIYTTIDLNLQRKAEDAAWNVLDHPDDPSVSIVSVDPKYPPGASLPVDVLRAGTPVSVDGKQVGTILTASEPPGFNPQEAQFLQRTNEALIYAMLGA
ncbi:MAG: penicillin-binding protein, partial [Chloroflexi bacterium]|nr:penicillin-binding protein [Chloroflexota bacterium]